MDWLSILVAALGISFGMTVFTVLSVRSESDWKLAIVSFLWTTPAVTLIFAIAGLPPDLGVTVGIVGIAIGALCTALICVARYVERKFQAS